MAPYAVLEAIAAPVQLLSIAVAILGIIAPFPFSIRLVPLALLMQSALFALSSKSMEAGLGFWLMVPLWLLFWGGMLAALLMRGLRHATPSEEAPVTHSYVPRVADCVFGAIAGGVLALWAALALHGVFEDSSAPVLVHWGIGGLSVLFGLAVLWIAPVRAKGLSAGGAVLCAITVWSITQPARMLADAARLAQGAPWCIELRQPDYVLERPEQAFALTTHARHTSLIVGPAPHKTYHWSRSFQAFRENGSRSHRGWGALGNRTLTCRPRDDFAQAVGRETVLDTYAARIGGLWYDVPRVYRPFIFSGLSIKASLPDIQPVPRESDAHHSILMEPARPDGQPHSIMDVAAGPPGAEGPLGLQAFASKHGFPVLAKTDADGLIETKINCIQSRPEAIRCQHRFVRDGALYSFDHAQEILPQWRELQENITAVFGSFHAGDP